MCVVSRGMGLKPTKSIVCRVQTTEQTNWVSPEMRQVRGDGTVDRGKKWSESTHVLKLLLPGFADGSNGEIERKQGCS